MKRVIVVVVAAAGLLMSCSNEPTDFRKAAEKAIIDGVKDQVGIEVTAECVNPESTKVGTTFECTATETDGTETAFVATITKKDRVEVEVAE